MKTITGQTGAWLSSARLNESTDDFSNLTLSTCDMTDCGWVKVGNASVTVELISDTELLTGQLAMLEEAERRVKADAQKKLTEIEGQRQRLLAIEYKPCQTTEA